MWHKIFFNRQSIQGETERSVLIKMPNRGIYLGFYFWHPKKLVREQGGKGYHLSFSFEDGWLFNIKKYGQGKYNSRDVIREDTLTVEEMKAAFGVVDENVNDFVEQETDKINEKIALSEDVETVIENHVPELKEPILNQLPHDSLTR